MFVARLESVCLWLSLSQYGCDYAWVSMVVTMLGSVCLWLGLSQYVCG